MGETLSEKPATFGLRHRLITKGNATNKKPETRNRHHEQSEVKKQETIHYELHRTSI